MGVSACIMQIVKGKKDIKDIKGSEILDYHIYFDHSFTDKVRPLFQDFFIKDGKTRFFVAKEIYLIGNGYQFQDGFLEDYDDNEGIYSLKEGLERLKPEAKKEAIEFLEDYFKCSVEYLYYDNSLFIDLFY